jgi:hypothetical protein
LEQGPGYFVLKGFGLEGDEASVRTRFASLAAVFGRVTGHGEGGEPVWRISPRGQVGHVPTFSETASEAPLHTDNSWVAQPERYFALLCERPAGYGGNSIVFGVEELRRGFGATADGSAAIRILSELEFPFAMPDVFRQTGQSAGEATVTAPVFGRREFRFREDVIRAGFLARPDLATPEARWAVARFNRYLVERLGRDRGLRLERGDVFFCNNHTCLHARTPFSDPQRLLWRVRMTGEGLRP